MCAELRKLRSNEAIRGFTRYVKNRVCAELRKLRSNEAIRGFTRYVKNRACVQNCVSCEATKQFVDLHDMQNIK